MVKAMKTFFVKIKCEIGKTYEVADLLVEKNVASEIHSIAGPFDIIAKFHVGDEVEIGVFVSSKIHTLKFIRDTETIIAFKAFV
jgi:DNA-binding Lrp family transcriptional regulator